MPRLGVRTHCWKQQPSLLGLGVRADCWQQQPSLLGLGVRADCWQQHGVPDAYAPLMAGSAETRAGSRSGRVSLITEPEKQQIECSRHPLLHFCLASLPLSSAFLASTVRHAMCAPCLSYLLPALHMPYP